MWMLRAVLGEGNISGCLWHRKCWVLDPRFDALNFVFIIAWSWNLRSLKREKSTIGFWHRELWGLHRWRGMNKILLDVSTWTFSLSHVEMLLHALITCSFPLIILVIETDSWWRIFSLALITYWVNVMIVVFCTGYLLKLLRVCKVTLISKTHGYSIETISFDIARNQSWVEGVILMRDLLVQLFNTWRKMKSLKVTHTVFQIWIWSICLWRVFGGRWRRATCEIHISTREPC